MKVRAVGIKILKNRLSEYVRLAASGETILVTDRDEVVAELNPVNPQRSRNLADVQLAEAVRNGFLSPPLCPPSDTPPPRKPVASTAQILDELAQDRDER